VQKQLTKFDIFMAVTMKSTIFRDVMPCSLVVHCPPQNASKLLPDYVASHSGQQCSTQNIGQDSQAQTGFLLNAASLHLQV
jgi:hypothetical protein